MSDSRIVLPWPPSINGYWRSVNGRQIISERGRQYRDAVSALALAGRWSKFGAQRVRVDIEAWVPDKRRRDLDNVLKSSLDALTHAGVWDDDSQIDDLRIYRAPGIGGMLKISIEPIGLKVSA